ncbi:hypothetical protein ACMHYJ_10060 [Castellaniella hirudinis]|uniref:hypothetical protein n=1 Tax=Castellaniella hirudinis TaxID=1144617 RepID=UPI0039C18E52
MADTPILPPPPMPAAPPTPQRSDPNTFEERADGFFDYAATDLPNAMDAVAANVRNNATAALEQAGHAAGSAGQASGSVTAAAEEVGKAKAEVTKAEAEAAKARAWAESDTPPAPGSKSAKSHAADAESAASSAWDAAAAAGGSLPHPLPPGAVLAVDSAGAVRWRGRVPYTVTADADLLAFDVVCIDTSGGPVTVTLPLDPAVGDRVSLFDGAATWADESPTVAGNGSPIMGESESMTLDIQYLSVDFLFINPIRGWVLV